MRRHTLPEVATQRQKRREHGDEPPLQPARRADADQLTQEEPEIEAARVDQQPTWAKCSTVLSYVEVNLHHQCVTRRLHRGQNRRLRLGQSGSSIRFHHSVNAADRNSSPWAATL